MKLTSMIFLISSIYSNCYAEMHSPFESSQSTCETLLLELDSCQLQGVILYAHYPVALMKCGDQQPINLTLNSVFLNKTKVIEITRQRMSVLLKNICDGAHYHWSLYGDMKGL